MEAGGILISAGIVTGFISATCLAPRAVGVFTSLSRTSRVQEMAAGESTHTGVGAILLRNGVTGLEPVARWALRFGPFEMLCSAAVWYCGEKGFVATTQSVAELLIALEPLVVVVGSAIAASVVFGLVAAACVLIILGIVVKQARERRDDVVRESIPDVLRSMSSCFHSGYTLLQTFRQLSEETEGPLHARFVRAASDLETGKTVDETLRELRCDAGIPEMAFVSVALEVQHHTGGSLQQILDTACDSVENELELRRSLRVQTAQARLSARVVTAMPFLLIAVFSLVTKDFLAPFFSSALGFAVLCLALSMQAAGIFLARRLLNVGGD